MLAYPNTRQSHDVDWQRFGLALTTIGSPSGRCSMICRRDVMVASRASSTRQTVRILVGLSCYTLADSASCSASRARKPAPHPPRMSDLELVVQWAEWASEVDYRARPILPQRVIKRCVGFAPPRGVWCDFEATR